MAGPSARPLPGVAIVDATVLRPSELLRELNCHIAERVPHPNLVHGQYRPHLDVAPT